MVGETAFPAGRIKVVTENGIVYLMGLVTVQEGEWATAIVSNVSGMLGIVKVFEYTN